MLDSQVFVPRHATHPHWKFLKDVGHKDLPSDNWLSQWIATAVRDPERRIAGLMLVASQQSTQALHNAIGSLFPTDYVLVTDKTLEHHASMMKGALRHGCGEVVKVC